jgi:hypothetical protein
MWTYIGLFWIAFASLVFEITLTRLLSVVTWYYLAFFAVATAMLGMTAGAIRVYLQPKRFTQENVHEEAANASIAFAVSIPISLILLCLIPIQFDWNTMFMIGTVICTIACAVPFYFSGTAVTLLLTKHWLPVGKLYASDLIGASLGCLFVLAGLGWFDAPSLLLVAGTIGAFAAWCLLANSPSVKLRRNTLLLTVVWGIAAVLNTSEYGIRPLIIKGTISPSTSYLVEKWNSFSRIVAFHEADSYPQLWGASPTCRPERPVRQIEMNIDGDAATYIRRFHDGKDIEHLQYDVTSIAHYLRPTGKACVIGVGGGRDIQCANNARCW